MHCERLAARTSLLSLAGRSEKRENSSQSVAFPAGASPSSRGHLVNTPELRDQRQATVLYAFGL
jgi:hypothetical protein